MAKALPISIGLFVILSLVGTSYYISDENNTYYCSSNNVVGQCFKLSNANSSGYSSRCYYNETTPTKYILCGNGWVLAKGIINTTFTANETSFVEEIELSNAARGNLSMLNIKDVSISDLRCDVDRCYFSMYKHNVIQDKFSIPKYTHIQRKIGEHYENISVGYDENNTEIVNSTLVEDFVTDQINYTIRDLKTMQRNFVIEKMSTLPGQLISKPTSYQKINDGYIQNLSGDSVK